MIKRDKARISHPAPAFQHLSLSLYPIHGPCAKAEHGGGLSVHLVSGRPKGHFGRNFGRKSLDFRKVSVLAFWQKEAVSLTTYRAKKKGYYVVARYFFLALLSVSAWNCLTVA